MPISRLVFLLKQSEREEEDKEEEEEDLKLYLSQYVSWHKSEDKLKCLL